MNKLIDMSKFIESGIDCEFINTSAISSRIDILDNIDSCDRYVTPYGHIYMKCNPRLHYKMYHDGHSCPLPEGLRVILFFRDGDVATSLTYHLLAGWRHNTVGNDIIGYAVTGQANGWSYPWEADSEQTTT